MSKLMKYLLFTFLIVWIFVGIAVYNGGLGATPALCMFMPTLGALIVKADIKEMGWRLRFFQNWKYIAIAYFAPTVFQFIGAVFYYLVFPKDFAPAEAFERFMSPAEYEEFVHNGKHYVSFIAKDILEGLNPFLAIMPIVLALGEEVGWRGFMYPMLKEGYGRTKGLLIGGVIHKKTRKSKGWCLDRSLLILSVL